MKKLFEHFDKQSKRSLLIRSYLSALLIFLTDLATGSELSLLVLYMFPISITSWFVNKKHGLIIAAFCAFANIINSQFAIHSQNLFIYPNIITIWNSLQLLIIFLAFGFMISTLKSIQIAKSNNEVILAQKVQKFLLPQSKPIMKNFEYAGSKKSFNNFSGDFFDYILLDENKLMLIIGDICGSGISAALLMAHIHGIIRSKNHQTDNLTELMNTINRSLHSSTDDDKFATLFIGVYDGENRTLTFVNAGHTPPLVLRSHKIIKLYNEGFILGINQDIVYSSSMLELEKGDLLFFYTDGLTESRNHQKEFYGEDRLIKHIYSKIKSTPQEISESIYQDIEKFNGLEPQQDDMTMIVGKVS